MPRFFFCFVIFCFPILAAAQPSGGVAGFSEETLQEHSERAAGVAAYVTGDEEPREGKNRVAVATSFYEQGRPGMFKQHPWYNDGQGRDLMESAMAYVQDSMVATQAPGGMMINPEWDAESAGSQPFLPTGGDLEKFQKCFEPRFIFPMNPWCQPLRARFKKPNELGKFFKWGKCPKDWNNGFLFSYRWPQTVIETNEFGMSAVNPMCFGRPDLTAPYAAYAKEEAIRPLFEEAYGEDAVKDAPSPFATQTGRSLSTKTGASNFTEAHLIESQVADYGTKNGRESVLDGLWHQICPLFGACFCVSAPFTFRYNGYKTGNPECFLGTTGDEIPNVHGYTEEVGGPGQQGNLLSFWRFPAASKQLDERLYALSTPLINEPGQTGNPLMGDDVDPIKTPVGDVMEVNYAYTRRCSSYLVDKYPERYGDLTKAAGIVGNSWPGAEELCVHGGGSRFPVTGYMPSPQRVSGGALIAWRALYLTEQEGLVANRTMKYSMEADRLQLIHPFPSDCFGIDEIDAMNKELFPIEAAPPQTFGSIRYMYWNQRVAATCQYHSSWPFPPLGAATYILGNQGCHSYESAPLTVPIDPLIRSITAVFGNTFPAPLSEEESIGDVYNQEVYGIDPLPPWPQGWPLDAAALLPEFIQQYAAILQAVLQLPGQISDTVQTISDLPSSIQGAVSTFQSNFGDAAGLVSGLEDFTIGNLGDLQNFAQNNLNMDMQQFATNYGPQPLYDNDRDRQFGNMRSPRVAMTNRNAPQSDWANFLGTPSGAVNAAQSLQALGEAAEMVEGLADMVSIGGLLNAVGLPALPNVWNYVEAAKQSYELNYFSDYDPVAACVTPPLTS